MSEQPYQVFVGRLLQRAFQAINRDLVYELRKVGYSDLTPSQAEALSCLAGSSLPIVMLAQQLGITKQAAGETVKQLEKMDYIIKSTSSRDARSYDVSLSARGKHLVEDAKAIKHALQVQYMHALGEQRFTVLVEALEIISEYE